MNWDAIKQLHEKIVIGGNLTKSNNFITYYPFEYSVFSCFCLDKMRNFENKFYKTNLVSYSLRDWCFYSELTSFSLSDKDNLFYDFTTKLSETDKKIFKFWYHSFYKHYHRLKMTSLKNGSDKIYHNISKELQTLFEKAKNIKNAELEVRIGQYEQNEKMELNFDNTIHKDWFFYFLKKFQSNKAFNTIPTIKIQEDIYHDGIKVRQYDFTTKDNFRADFHSDKTVIIQKKLYEGLDVPLSGESYSLRFRLVSEVDKSASFRSGNALYHRFKQVYTFYLAPFRYEFKIIYSTKDVSNWNQLHKSNNIKTTYEIEIEYDNTNPNNLSQEQLSQLFTLNAYFFIMDPFQEQQQQNVNNNMNMLIPSNNNYMLQQQTSPSGSDINQLFQALQQLQPNVNLSQQQPYPNYNNTNNFNNNLNNYNFVPNNNGFY